MQSDGVGLDDVSAENSLKTLFSSLHHEEFTFSLFEFFTLSHFHTLKN